MNIMYNHLKNTCDSSVLPSSPLKKSCILFLSSSLKPSNRFTLPVSRRNFNCQPRATRLQYTSVTSSAPNVSDFFFKLLIKNNLSVKITYSSCLSIFEDNTLTAHSKSPLVHCTAHLLTDGEIKRLRSHRHFFSFFFFFLFELGYFILSSL